MELINERFNFRRARNAEHAQVHEDILGAASAEFAEKHQISPIRSKYQAVYDIEKECYLRNQGFESTPDIEALDDKRGSLFIFISKMIDASTYNPDEAIAAAGKHLAFVLKPHEQAYKLGYAQETASITDFVEKMQAAENVEDVAAVGLTKAVEDLSETNKAFNELYATRSQESSERASNETMVTIRPKVDKAFKEFAATLNALYKVNEVVTKSSETRDSLEPVIKRINGFLHQLQLTLSRAGLGGSTSDKPDEADEGDEPTPEPVTPEITAVYQKEGGDPENPHRIGRDEQTMVEYQGFTLKGQDGTLEHVIGLVNDQDYIEWINPETITNVTETSCEFTMVPDLTEGQYKVRIETYDGGSPLVVEYPEPITLW